MGSSFSMSWDDLEPGEQELFRIMWNQTGPSPTQHYLSRQTWFLVVMTVIYTLVFISCFIGNSLVILVVCYHKNMRNGTNFFLTNLAVADLGVGLFCIYQNLSLYLMDEDWAFGEWLCKMYHFIHALSYTASVLVMVAVSIERYIAIVYPIKSRSILRMRNLRIAMVTIWFLSVIICTPRIKMFGLAPMAGPKPFEIEAICILKWEEYGQASKYFNIMNATVLFVIPVTIMSYVYIKLAYKLCDREISDTTQVTSTVTVSQNGTKAKCVSLGHNCGVPKNGRSGNRQIKKASPLRDQAASRDHLNEAHGPRNDCQTQRPGKTASDSSLDKVQVKASGSENGIKGSGLKISVIEKSGLKHEQRDILQHVQDLDGKSSSRFLDVANRDVPRKTESEESDSEADDNDKRQSDEAKIGTLHEEENKKRDKNDKSVKSGNIHWTGSKDEIDDTPMPRIVIDANCSNDDDTSDRTHERWPSQHNDDMDDGGDGGSGFEDGEDEEEDDQENNLVGGQMRRDRTDAKDGDQEMDLIEPDRRRSNKKKKKKKVTPATKARRKVIRLLIVVVLVFIFCHLPWHVRKLLQDWKPNYNGGSSESILFTWFTTILMYSNSGINPLLYALMSEKFRKSMSQVLSCNRGGTQNYRSTASTAPAVMGRDVSPRMATRTTRV